MFYHIFLKNIEVPEFKNSYQKYKDKFSNIIKILKHVKEPSYKDTFFKRAIKEFELIRIA